MSLIAGIRNRCSAPQINPPLNIDAIWEMRFAICADPCIQRDRCGN